MGGGAFILLASEVLVGSDKRLHVNWGDKISLGAPCVLAHGPGHGRKTTKAPASRPCPVSLERAAAERRLALEPRGVKRGLAASL